ncbi:hypothetical protein QRD90_05520 [Peribacillus frigoritolerans]|jgi:DnaJ-class molecular chaperone|nr:hypothetical protein [Peribacillus frigoritolerans]USK81397.1 hypothetical protein LHV56_05510 [Peribacillus frigoritolerans]WJE48677.1 hypothetical protein QRD90_05520 [Peribacillus frigoritolerans]
MKLITICQHCKGKGKTRYLQFFSRDCNHCNGQGKAVKDMSNIRNQAKNI